MRERAEKLTTEAHRATEGHREEEEKLQRRDAEIAQRTAEE